MSQATRLEALAQKRDRYARAGKEHKTKIINEVLELFDYHRKAAIPALQPRPVIAAPFVIGRPREYDPDQLRGPLKAIWLAALQPCGVPRGLPHRASLCFGPLPKFSSRSHSVPPPGMARPGACSAL